MHTIREKYAKRQRETMKKERKLVKKRGNIL
jgi:hypothetical protein